MSHDTPAGSSASRLKWWLFAAFSVFGCGGLAVVWIVAAYFQMLNAWGFRGMPKPLWFEALSWAVWLGPVVAALVLPLMFIGGLYLLSRPSRNA